MLGNSKTNVCTESVYSPFFVPLSLFALASIAGVAEVSPEKHNERALYVYMDMKNTV